MRYDSYSFCKEINMAQKKIHRKKNWPKVVRFSGMPVCLKSGISAKPLYIRIHHYGFRCDIAMCKLCNFFAFLSFKITVLALFMIFFFCVGCQIWLQIGTNFWFFLDQLLIVWPGEPECSKMWSGQFNLSHLGQIWPTLNKTDIHGLHHL